MRCAAYSCPQIKLSRAVLLMLLLRALLGWSPTRTQ
jgi:hypothetical protein